MCSGWRIAKYDKEKGWHDPVLDLIVSVSQDASRRLRTIEESVTISALCFISSLSTQLGFISVCPEEPRSQREGGFRSSKQISLNHCDRIFSYSHALFLVTPCFATLCDTHKHWVMTHCTVGVSRIIKMFFLWMNLSPTMTPLMKHLSQVYKQLSYKTADMSQYMWRRWARDAS